MSAKFLVTDLTTDISRRRKQPIKVCLDMTFIVACFIVSVTIAGYCIALF